jgi:hypothetical protein
MCKKVSELVKVATSNPADVAGDGAGVFGGGCAAGAAWSPPLAAAADVPGGVASVAVSVVVSAAAVSAGAGPAVSSSATAQTIPVICR